jgi:hypothetical protein
LVFKASIEGGKRWCRAVRKYPIQQARATTDILTHARDAKTWGTKEWSYLLVSTIRSGIAVKVISGMGWVQQSSPCHAACRCYAVRRTRPTTTQEPSPLLARPANLASELPRPTETLSVKSTELNNPNVDQILDLPRYEYDFHINLPHDVLYCFSANPVSRPMREPNQQFMCCAFFCDYVLCFLKKRSK